MPVDRPILERWKSSPWVAATPVDDRSIGGILQDEVQVAFRGDGPMSRRELVPLTPAARELLHGTHRAGAQRFFQGVLATLDGLEGVSRLRGMSLSTDVASFATNLLMSNVESGFVPDHAAAGDAAGFERSMLALVPSVGVAKAQNTGWLDLGPRVSRMARDVIAHGPEVGRDDGNEVALTLLHELQHSITPLDPNTVAERHVWLEEGIAETLAWWPGAASALRERIGGRAAAADEAVDPWTAPAGSTASAEYANRHRSVLGLLGLAGVQAYADDGSIDPAAHDRARQLLQGDAIERVSRNLARAIVARHDLDPAREPELRDRIEAVAGRPAAVDDLASSLGIAA